MQAIGVDIGGTKIAVGVVDDGGNILAQTRIKTDPTDAASIDRGIADACLDLMKDHEVAGIGVAAAGFVNADRKTMDFAPNIDWRNYPLADKVSALLADGDAGADVPVVVENDANAAGWAEFRFGAGREATDMLMLTIGTGLGGALILGSELVRGKYGMAAEVGHMRFSPGGHYCGCGHEGCWEMYASGTALVRAARKAAVAWPHRAATLLELAGGDRRRINGPMVTKAAEDGDPLSIKLLADLGRFIGEGAASVTALLDVELVVVGGGVAAAGDLLLDPIREGFEDQLPALDYRTEARIELAQWGNDAGIVGAADLARL